MIDVIQAKFEELERITDRFSQQSEAVSQMLQTVLRVMSPLQDGGWIGEGSDAFFSEMENDLLPGVRRLIEALARAGQVTGQINQILQGADEEASSYFRSDPMAGGTTLGVGSVPGGGTWGNGQFTPAGPGILQNMVGNIGFSPGGDSGFSPGGNDWGIPGDWLSGVTGSLHGYMGNNYNEWGIPHDWLSGVAGGRLVKVAPMIGESLKTGYPA